MVANEMRRDNSNIFQNDHIAFVLDTFYDRRNGVVFAINAIGGRWDGQITNERQINADWNPVWDVDGRPLRRRLDGRGRDPVQVAALPAGPRADLGLQRAPRQPLEERDRRT